MFKIFHCYFHPPIH